ncbi:hypothetical protein N7470_002118 [Penicillium chermesinum]|nr:hypothetical protein N7470_002118 [Penicillium chermesinum]
MQSRKPQGSRLRPVADPLDRAGFVTKGDRMLLDHEEQEKYYNIIVERWLRFCSNHSKDLDAALTSLPTSSSNDATSNPPSCARDERSRKGKHPTFGGIVQAASFPPEAARRNARSLESYPRGFCTARPRVFDSSVHTRPPPSFVFPFLEHTLERLHSKAHPLPAAEVKELVTYLILDYACRQEAMASAFELRARARREHGFHSQVVDRLLESLIQDNWVVFWQVHKSVDSYQRAVMNWAVDRMRRHALKAVGSAYLNVHVSWVVGGCTGGDGSWTWEKLVDTENLGWEREGDKIVIRRPKTRPAPTPAST